MLVVRSQGPLLRDHRHHGLAIIVEAIAKIGPTLTDDGVNPRGWALQVPTLDERRRRARPSLISTSRCSAVRADRRAGRLLIVFSIMIADFFDTIGTPRQSAPRAARRGPQPARAAGAAGRLLAAAAGGAAALSKTTYIESAAVGRRRPHRPGQRRPGVLFLVATFFSRWSRWSRRRRAPFLVIVGALLISQINDLVWTTCLVIPAFLTIALMPFTYSITNGIGAGVITFVLLRLRSAGAARSTRSCGSSRRCSSSTSRWSRCSSCSESWRLPSC